MAAETPGTGNGGKAVGRAVDEASSGAHEKIDRASRIVHPAVDDLASGAHRAVDRIAGAATDTADTLDARAEQFREARLQMTDQLRDYVREHPIQALGIAVAGGFLLSRLISR